MTEFNAVTELLKAVDALSTTQTTSVWQEIDGEHKPAKATLTPLIRELRESISSDGGAQGGGGALKSQRNVIDADALDMYGWLCDSILESYGAVTAAKPFATPEQNLRQWYIAFANDHQAGKVSEDNLLKALNKWSGWVRRIEDKLWPATTLEITSPCPEPECGKRWAMTTEGEGITAIVVEYRQPSEGSNPLSRSVARCRACNHVWRGDFALRQLRYALDENDNQEIDDIVEKNAGQVG